MTSHCRLCAECKPYIKLVDLSYDDDKRSEINTKLTRLNSPVCEVFANNDLPKTVCLVCINALNNCYDFILNIETAQNVLDKIYTEQPVTKSDSTSNESQCEPLKELYLVDKIIEKPAKNEKVKKKKPPPILTSNRMTWKEYSWACSQCDTMFPSLDELQTHTIEIHGICNRYKCTECNTFRNRRNLDKLILHVGRKHKTDLKYSCYKCHLQFNTPQMCSKHKLEHKHPGLSCPGCNYVFNNIQDLNDHKAKYYKGVSYKLGLPDIPITNRLTCHVCHITCKSRYLLLRHLSTRHGSSKKEFLCDNCGKGFLTKGSLLQHSPVHADERLYKCEKCSLSFKSSMLLKSHGSVHNEVKPFPCSDCKKTFRKKSQLNIHRALHTGEKRHICVHCNKEFRWKNSLVQHIRQHTGERPYKCEQCSRSFTNWSNYRKHTKGVHGMGDLAKKNLQS